MATSGLNGHGEGISTGTQHAVKIPAYLNQQKAQLSKRFHELEWQQRYRLQHAYNYPETSPFRMDKSDMVVNRNRYGNVQPWDPTRVRLRTPIGGSDYINASPISLKSHSSTPSSRPDSTPASIPDNSSSIVKLSEMRYIATQGPKDDQFAHFWYMVMQETVGPMAVIVMLTPCYEGIKEKCSQYFPKNLDGPVLVLDAGELAAAEAESENGDPFMSPKRTGAGADTVTTDSSTNNDMIETDGTEDPGEVGAAASEPSSGPLQESAEAKPDAHPPSGSVTLLSMEMDPKSRCEIRRMRLEIDGETKEIFHYLFNGWPDYGKPEGDDRRALLELTRQTRERVQSIEAGASGIPVDGTGNPRFVHCSAGVGRTGTFIALDWLLYQLEEGNLVPKATEQDSNAAAHQENSKVNGNSKGESWGKSGPTKEKESTPEAKEGYDLVFETVNKLREQRMMMVMNEIQYSFLYEVVKEAFVEKYARAPTVGVTDVANAEAVNSHGVLVKGGEDDDGGGWPESQQEGLLSEAETEIEGDPYEAVAPQGIRTEVEGAKGVGAE